MYNSSSGLHPESIETATFEVSDDQVSCLLAGEAVILSLKSGVYYGLDAVGARIWELCHQPKTVNEIREALLAEFDVDPLLCERELIEFLATLSSKELVQIGGLSNV